MKVKKFELKLQTGKSSSSSGKKYDQKNEMNSLYPGFLLKRFQTEQEFNRFEESILESKSKICGFQDFLGDDFKISLPLDDDVVADQPEVIGSDSIFLSMINATEIWKNHEKPIQLEHKFSAQEAGYYFLFYQICIKADNINIYTHSGTRKNQGNLDNLFKSITSSFELEIEHYNIDMFGKVSYLPTGKMILPHLFLYFSISYTLLLFLWLRSTRNQNESMGMEDNIQTHRTKVYAIHHFMSCVLALKTLSILFESVRYHYIRINGHAEFWTFFYYTLNFIKGTFLFAVILLLGSGWSFFQSVLSPKQAKVICVVFLLQVLDNVALLVLTQETMGEKLYNYWSAVLHLLDIISCGVIVIPIIWQVTSLDESLERIHSNDNSGDNDMNIGKQDLESKISLFRSFYIMVVTYIYFTRVIIYLITSGLTYKYVWIQDFILEIGTLLFYVSVGTLFVPKSEDDSLKRSDQYAQVDTDDDEIELAETIIKQ